MTIAFTGGATGGHFYPLIAIAEALQDIVREERLIEPKLYYLAPNPFDEKALFENNIVYLYEPAGKLRRYASWRNFTDWFVTFFGVIKAVLSLFQIYPDVLVSKGGYASVPTVIAARLLRIPIIIHESDAKPGRSNLFAAPFAKKIAVAFDSAAQYFPKKVQDKIARTGIPIRKALMRIEPEGARQYLGLEANLPTVLILGGSLGSVRINDVVISALPELVALANVIHQTGAGNAKAVESLGKVVLDKNPHEDRYHPFGYLDQVSMQRAAGVADVIVSRAGATAIAEIGLWHKPAILIPIPESVSHDQRSNAYAFADTGAAIVIEETNLTPHLFSAEIKRILDDKALAARMSAAAKDFTDKDAARILAREVLDLALVHEV
jgi:UDP-N-acetylglucosamine--N-acetylmuramyl-(pentapeptide) pyrophosphoryl-undecaprenol N-acetylglucosamine transferase